MWPVVLGLLRSNAVYITLPIAVVVGCIGYNIENLVSDKHTPSNKSVLENRSERLAADNVLSDAANVKSLMYQENVLGRNLSPSLSKQS